MCLSNSKAFEMIITAYETNLSFDEFKTWVAERYIYTVIAIFGVTL